MSEPVPFVILIPVKPPSIGKSRLSTMPAAKRILLATAFARDTIAAALAAPGVAEVMVVTDDHRFAAVASDQGCFVIPDGVYGDLNATLVQAAHECARRWPAYGIAALCADLPALRPEELGAALQQVAASGAAFVADEPDTGTTMYAVRQLDDFAPNFGHDSAARHRAAGAAPVTGRLVGLRRDVDEAGDLQEVLMLGVGPHTAATI